MKVLNIRDLPRDERGEALREALEPFAAWGESVIRTKPLSELADSAIIMHYDGAVVTAGDLRQAQQALVAVPVSPVSVSTQTPKSRA